MRRTMHSNRLLQPSIIAVIAAVMALAGCSGRPEGAPATPIETTTQPWMAQLTPPGELPPRTASIAPPRFRTGAQFEAAAPYSFGAVADAGYGNAEFSPDYDTTLEPPHTTLAFAMYSFDLAGLSGLDETLRYAFETPPTNWDDLWIGLANWQRQRWDFYASGGTGVLALPAPGLVNYIDQDDALLAAVVMVGTSPAQLSWLAIGGNIAPEASFEADPMEIPAGEIVYFLASSSMDYDGTVAKFEFDFGEGVGFEDNGADNSVQHTYNMPGEFTAQLRATDDGGLLDTDALTIVVGEATHGVIAHLAVDQPSGRVPLALSYDAQASLPSTGETITQYDFDFNGDGTVDQSSSAATGSFFFEWATTATATVTVTDSAAQSDTASVDLNLVDARGWLQTMQVTDAGPSFALFEVSGRPALAYDRNTSKALYFKRSLGSLGLYWPSPVLLDIASDVCARMGGAMIDGHPALAYLNRFEGNEDAEVIYAFCDDPVGMTESDWNRSRVEVLGNPAYDEDWLDLAPAGAGAGVLYRTRNPANFVFRSCPTYRATAWNARVVLSTAEFSSDSLSLAVVDGYPAAAYHRSEVSSATGVYYRLALDTAGAAWDSEQTVAENATYDYGADGLCLAQYGDLLGVSMQQHNSTGLYFARHDPDIPGTWLLQFANGNDGENGEYSQWAMLGGRPVIASREATDYGAVFRRAEDALGDDWPNASTIIDDGEPGNKDVGKYMQLIVIKGTPMVAYYNASNATIRFAVLTE